MSSTASAISLAIVARMSVSVGRSLACGAAVSFSGSWRFLVRRRLGWVVTAACPCAFLNSLGVVFMTHPLCVFDVLRRVAGDVRKQIVLDVLECPTAGVAVKQERVDGPAGFRIEQGVQSVVRSVGIATGALAQLQPITGRLAAMRFSRMTVSVVMVVAPSERNLSLRSAATPVSGFAALSRGARPTMANTGVGTQPTRSSRWLYPPARSRTTGSSPGLVRCMRS